MKDTATNELIPVTLQSVREQMKISPPTMWRIVRRGWIKTTNIAGRPYVMPEALAEFKARAEAGEFAKPRLGASKIASDARRARQAKDQETATAAN